MEQVAPMQVDSPPRQPRGGRTWYSQASSQRHEHPTNHSMDSLDRNPNKDQSSPQAATLPHSPAIPTHQLQLREIQDNTQSIPPYAFLALSLPSLPPSLSFPPPPHNWPPLPPPPPPPLLLLLLPLPLRPPNLGQCGYQKFLLIWILMILDPTH
jgi:hypothetical protein